MAVGADGPTGRAKVIAEILRLAEAVEPGARISLRLRMGDPQDVARPQDRRCCLLGLEPGETWVLTASDVVLDAVEEAFGVNMEQPSTEDDSSSLEPF